MPLNGVPQQKPRLAPGTRLQWDAIRERHVLLFPEGALALNPTAAAILELCDGGRTLDEIVRELVLRYQGADVRADVESLVDTIAARGLLLRV